MRSSALSATRRAAATASRQAPVLAAVRRGAATAALSAPKPAARAPLALATGAALAGLALATAPEAKAEGVPHGGIPGTKHERTFIAIKPDGVQRGLVNEIIKRFEQKGYKLVGIKILQPTKSFAEQHYADLSKKPFFNGLVSYFTSGPVVAMVWEGLDAAAGGRRILGETNPADSKPGSVRGDLSIEIGRNVCHGSDSPESAQHEIGLWFKEGEVCSWTPSNDRWVYEK